MAAVAQVLVFAVSEYMRAATEAAEVSAVEVERGEQRVAAFVVAEHAAAVDCIDHTLVGHMRHVQVGSILGQEV